MSARLTLPAVALFGVALAAQVAQPARTVRLPETPYEYANVTLPAHLQAMRTVDNTPADNPITNDGATLGRVLFYDTALSANGTTSCSSCHKQQHAFADPNRVSRGFDGRLTERHAMNLTGLRYYPSGQFFWDERGGNLEAMVLLPVRNPIEMGEDPARLPQKLSALPYYPELFRRAFGDPVITEARLGLALAQFLRSLVSCHSRFDEGRARARSDEDDFENFTRQENRGKALFLRNCASCHLETEEAPFTLIVPRNNGTELDPRTADGGLGDITLNAMDVGLFKSPTLRNVEVAGPYMHNGSLPTLEAVVAHYSGSFKQHPNLDSRMVRLNLTLSEQGALVAFLKTLTDRAFLTDPRFSDPFDPPGTMAAPVEAFRPAPRSTMPLPARGDIDTVVARVMSFDATGDGRVSRPELPDRMQSLIGRGDRNGDAAVDSAEVRVISSSSSMVGVGIGIFLRGSSRQVDVTVRNLPNPGFEGLVDDLRLPPDRRASALAAVAEVEAETARKLTASIETVRADVDALTTADQFAALDARIQSNGNLLRQLLRELAAPAGRPTLPLPRLDATRIAGALGLTGDALGGVQRALDEHLERVRELWTDRSDLLRQMTPVLTSDELADFAASLDRHRVTLTREP